jgi:hypothetical protein
VEHGGNVPGFSAQVAMLPEFNLGFVLLTNVTSTSLQPESINMVWDTLVGDWMDDAEATVYDQYVGKYIANFGTFEDEEFTVLVQNGRLAVDVPGQMVYELKAPDEEEKWYFAITDTVAVSFERDGGNAFKMNMHQGGLTFELPRLGVEMSPEIPLDELEKYLGSYSSDELEVSVEVLVQNNRLAVDWPGEMVYELRTPNQEGIWVFRVSEAFTLSFSETPEGGIVSLTYYQSGLEYQFARNEVDPLPTVEEVLALRQTGSRVEALREMGTYRITGTVRIPQSGVTGTFSMYIAGEDRYRVDSDYGKFGTIRRIINGDQTWTESSWEPAKELHGKLLEQARQSHPAANFGDLSDYVDTIRILRSEELDGQEVYVLRLQRGELPAAKVYVDSTTGDILKSVGFVVSEGGSAIPVTTRFEDYREVHGVRIPFRATSSNEATGSAISQYETVEINLDVGDEIFTMGHRPGGLGRRRGQEPHPGHLDEGQSPA